MSLNVSTVMTSSTPRHLLESLWQHGVSAVGGRASVNRFFEKHPISNGDYSVIAIGKAAADMMLGARDSLGEQLKSGLVITKHKHLNNELAQFTQISCYEASHPIPDESSLDAGRILLEYIQSSPHSHRVLVLISGGASSLVEVLKEGCTLDDLKTISQWAFKNGLNINEVNYMRQKISLIKGGKLCRFFSQQEVTCLYISDVPGDNINVIGSGLLYCDQRVSELISPASKAEIDNYLSTRLPSLQLNENITVAFESFKHHVISNNQLAKSAIADYATSLGYNIYVNEDSIYKDYHEAAELVFKQITQSSSASDKIFIWGGEPTVELPDNPGDGGRNQALALLLGSKIHDLDMTILVAGTDGTDGPTDAAGGVVDGGTVKRAQEKGWDIATVLMEANSYHCLKSIGALFSPGPTGTNVMDLIIILVGDINHTSRFNEA